MTPFRWLGLILAGAILVALELAAREHARRHWNSQRGVFWREAVGHGLVLLVTTGYCYAVGLPLLPVAATWAFSLAVLLMLLAWAEGCMVQNTFILSLEAAQALTIESYAELWNSIHADKGTRWEDNPEVWVLEFERVGSDHGEPPRIAVAKEVMRIAYFWKR